MSDLINIGKRDADGRQVRIEHRGRYTRVSRTGGVALRAQAKAAGLNFTINSRHGARVSKRLAKNTQVAMQNGRFVIRGRYGDGPHKLNLSKTGLTASTKNQLGTFNWIKPNRSSAKLFGVQVRGKKAAQMQAAYLLFVVIGQGIVLAINLIAYALKLVVWLLQRVFAGLMMFSHGVYNLPSKIRSWQLTRFIKQARLRINQPPPHQNSDQLDKQQQQILAWDTAQRLSAVTLIHQLWGQGGSLLTSDKFEKVQQVLKSAGLLIEQEPLMQVNDTLMRWAAGFDEQQPLVDEWVVLLQLVAQLNQQPDNPLQLEWVLALDEAAVTSGTTPLQTAMLNLLMDELGIDLDPVEK